MNWIQISSRLPLMFAATLWLTAPANAQQTKTKQESTLPDSVADTVDPVLYNRIVKAGTDYLLEKGQDREDGSFSKDKSPAVTALCLAALLDSGVSPDHPQVTRGISYLLGFYHEEDGGIYAPNSALQNYETSISLICLTRANVDGRYDQQIGNGLAFIKKIQWDEGEGIDSTNTFYGGQGYGSHKRPDASNTSFFLDALKDCGEATDSEATSKAVLFMSRTQNLRSEFNNSEWAEKVSEEDRGGFIYSPAGAGETKAEAIPGGGLRSYASMTYAGLKSFLYAGLDKEDFRVKAALEWISRNYDVDSNPGIGQQGLYYYYHVFAKALHTMGERTIRDSDGTLHNWRSDLVNAIAKRQQADGSWINPTDRWMEGDPNLVTAYTLLALRYCHPDLDRDE